MKHLFFISFFCAGFVSFGQDSIHKTVKKLYPIYPQYIVKSNPLRTLWGSIPLTSEYRINYEMVTSAASSQEIALSLYGRTPFLNLNNNNAGTTLDNLRAQGIRFQYAYRFYLKGINQSIAYTNNGYAPEGFYISPHFSYATARFYDRTQPRHRRDYLQAEHVDVNLFIGRQFIINGNWVFEVYAGGGYKRNRWFEAFSNGVRRSTTIVEWDYYNANYRLHLGFNIGFGWK